MGSNSKGTMIELTGIATSKCIGDYVVWVWQSGVTKWCGCGKVV